MSIVVVDDFSNNPDLNYVGDWTHLFSIGGATNNTVSYSQTVGSYIEFVFNGKFTKPPYILGPYDLNYFYRYGYRRGGYGAAHEPQLDTTNLDLCRR